MMTAISFKPAKKTNFPLYNNGAHYKGNQRRLLLIYLLFYYSVFLSFASNQQLLSQYQPLFFNYNRDLSELILIGTGLPRFMVLHPRTFLLADILVLVLPLLLGFAFLRRHRFWFPVAIVFTVFIGSYLLLTNIFWEAHPEPYVQFFLLSFVFWTHGEERFNQVLAGCRLYFLYLFLSAAIWKIARGAFLNPSEMSYILLNQHKELLTGSCNTLSCRSFLFLIGHLVSSYLLYLGGMLLELIFLAGFFTRRWDRWLAGAAILFVVADFFVMRLSYWPVLIGLAPLLLVPGRPFPFTRRP